jgi:hypothetical protein
MLIQLNIHALLAIFLSLSLGVMAPMPSCQNTTGIICDGNFSVDTSTHTQNECTTDLFQPVPLQSCAHGNLNLGIYWFLYSDVCRFNSILIKFFAYVGSDNTTQCINRSGLNITYDSCVNNYIFTRDLMIIKNITKSTPQKYICYLSDKMIPMHYATGIIYSINILGQFI